MSDLNEFKLRKLDITDCIGCEKNRSEYSYKCGKGTIISGNVCTVDANVCGTGTKFENGKCILNTTASICGEGTTFENGKCILANSGSAGGIGTVYIDEQCKNVFTDWWDRNCIY